jgi:8-amino-7-oxononanoate synthase
MATHSREVLDRALGVFENVKQNFEREHGSLPEPLA